MSDDGAEVSTELETSFVELEEAAGALLGEMAELRDRVQRAEEENEELGELVRRFTDDDEAPDRLLTRLRRLESENGELTARMDEGREGIERLLARIRFLEEQR